MCIGKFWECHGVCQKIFLRPGGYWGDQPLVGEDQRWLGLIPVPGQTDAGEGKDY